MGVVPITLKYKPRKPKLVQQGGQDQDQHYQQVGWSAGYKYLILGPVRVPYTAAKVASSE